MKAIRIKNVVLPVLILTLIACSEAGSSGPVAEKKEFPDQEGWNSEAIVSQNGRPKVRIRYAHMEKYTKKAEMHFDGGIVADFYNAEGEHTSRLTADRGIMYETFQNFEAFGNVYFVSDSGMTLRSERLKWNNARERVSSDTFCTITTAEGDTLYGEGFESDPHLRNWTIMKPRGVSSKAVDLSGIDADAEGNGSN